MSRLIRVPHFQSSLSFNYQVAIKYCLSVHSCVHHFNRNLLLSPIYPRETKEESKQHGCTSAFVIFNQIIHLSMVLISVLYINSHSTNIKMEPRDFACIEISTYLYGSVYLTSLLIEFVWLSNKLDNMY